MFSPKPQKSILNESKYEYEDTMIPKELNIAPIPPSHILPPISTSRSIPAEKIIDAIKRAMTLEERVRAFETALSAFSHKNSNLHSHEIDLGAVHALVLQFGACLSLQHNNDGASSERKEEFVVHLILQCLYQILSNCSTRYKIQIWQDLGANELLPLLLRLPPSPLSWSLIRIFCKITNAKSSLLACPSLMKQIVDVLKPDAKFHCNYNELITTALGVIKDLSFRSENDEKIALWKYVVYSTERLCIICEEPSEEYRHKEYIIMIWWNLALLETIAQDLISTNRVVSTLQRIVVDLNNSVTLRRSAIAALGTLVATTTTNVPDMQSIENMINEGKLWQSLIRLVKHETDIDCRRRGLRTIRCLTTASKDIPPQLINILADVAKSDHDEHARLQALEALRCIDCKNLDWALALVSVITAENTIESKWEQSRSHTLACSILQSCCDPSILITCSEKKGFFEALSKTEVATMSKIISTIASNGGKDKLLSDSGISLLSMAIISSIPRLPILRIIKELADSSAENRKQMAKSDPLLTAAVNLCLSTSVEEEKQMAKAIIVALVAEL